MAIEPSGFTLPFMGSERSGIPVDGFMAVTSTFAPSVVVANIWFGIVTIPVDGSIVADTSSPVDQKF